MTDRLEVRPALPDDVPEILSLIRELAVYERLEHAVTATPELLRRHLFETPRAHVLLARANGETVGYALFFHNFSTFLGTPGIYLEDLYVKPAHRGKGYGRTLLSRLAALAGELGCARLEWCVLDWNETAIGFYRSLGAAPLSDWTLFRLTGKALLDLAGGPAAPSEVPPS